VNTAAPKQVIERDRHHCPIRIGPPQRFERGGTAESVRGSKLVILKGMGHALPISLWPQIIDAIAAHAV
jgi:hypothetical protein